MKEIMSNLVQSFGDQIFFWTHDFKLVISY